MLYFEEHYLIVNAEKTKVMIVKQKRCTNYGDSELYVDKEKLEVIQSFRYSA